MTGFGAALWLGAIAPLAGVIAASWGALTIVHALAVAITTALALLVTAAGALLAADWRADAQSCQAWRQVDLPPVELSLPANAATRGDLDPFYLPAVDNEALRRVFQAHRFAPQTPMLDSRERVSASAEEASQVDLAERSARAVARTIPAAATIVAASHRKALGARRATARVRLVVNASTWRGQPGAECIVSPLAPQRHTADVIVLGSRRDDQARPLPEASASGDISSSTEPPSCRGPPQEGRPACAVGAVSPERAPHVPSAGKWPTADPILRDNLGDQVPICARELDVIETYLDQVLRDLFASSTGGSEREQA
jgi:hypothetical protein